MIDIRYEIRKFFRNEHAQAIAVALVLAGLVYLTMKFGAAVLVVATIPIGYGFHWLWRNFVQIRRLYRSTTLGDAHKLTLSETLSLIAESYGELREAGQTRFARELRREANAFRDVLNGDTAVQDEPVRAHSLFGRITLRVQQAKTFRQTLFAAAQARADALAEATRETAKAESEHAARLAAIAQSRDSVVQAADATILSAQQGLRTLDEVPLEQSLAA